MIIKRSIVGDVFISNSQNLIKGLNLHIETKKQNFFFNSGIQNLTNFSTSSILIAISISFLMSLFMHLSISFEFLNGAVGGIDTIIGDEEQVTHFTEKIQSCFLTKKEIIEWRNGYKFKDPWPKNIVKINDNLS